MTETLSSNKVIQEYAKAAETKKFSKKMRRGF